MSRVLRKPVDDNASVELNTSGIPVSRFSVVPLTITYNTADTITYVDIPEGTTAILVRCITASKPLGLGIQTFDPTAVNGEDPDFLPGVVNPSIELWEIGLSVTSPDVEEWILIDSLESTSYTYDDPEDTITTRFPRLEIHKAPLGSGNVQKLRIIFFHG